MDELPKKSKELLDRLRKGASPAAAVAGAFASFASAARGEFRKTPEHPRADESAQVNLPEAKTTSVHALALQYVQSGSFKVKFRRSVSGIAVSLDDKIYVLSDGEVGIFERTGASVGSWKAPENASCVAVGRDGRVCVGAAGRVHIFKAAGIRDHEFEAGEPGKPAKITAIKVLPKEILVADAAARFIRRFDFNGRRLGEIGNQNKTQGFMLPNRSLDIDVDDKGIVVATDSGRHRVSAWTLDGSPLRHFGRFGLVKPEDFVGCCNPVNLSFAPGGKIVTAEKLIPRVKVYDSTGKLLALIGPDHFDRKCAQLHLAADSEGRILVADPVRLEIKIFSQKINSGARESV